MIISHRHRFIFIKNRKVAGTSVEMALAPLCGPDDVLSPDTPERDRVSGTDELMKHARNYEGGFNVLAELALDPHPYAVVRVLRDRLKRHRYYNHMRASSVRARVGADIWNSYYKFCFDRNPWSKMISFYYWSNRYAPGAVTLDEFVCAPKKGLTMDQKYPTDWARYTLKDKLIVDDVFDYDDLEANLAEALRRAGIAQPLIDTVVLPQAKTMIRKTRAETLTARSDDVIRRVFAREIDMFGYVAPPGLLA